MELNKDLLIERLSSKLELRGVFLYEDWLGDTWVEHLMLVVSAVKGVSPTTMAPIVRLCMVDMPEIPFHIIIEGEWLNQLRKGSLYHSYASLPIHRIYYSRPKEIDLLLNKKIINSMAEVNQKEYEKALGYAKEYLSASSEFALKEKYDQGVFMLHQYLEVKIRAFYGLMGGQFGKTHNLEYIIKKVRSAAPSLLSIFAYDVADVELYRLLDTAYKSCVKGGSMEVSAEQYEFVRTQSVFLAELLDAMVNRMIAEVATYRAQLPTDKPKEEKRSAVQVVEQKENSNKSHQVVVEDFSDFPWPQRYKDDAKALLDDIYSKHRPEQILLVNYRTGGLTKGNPFQEKASKPMEELEMHLVVLMKNRGPFRYREVRRGVVCVTMVFLNVSYVERSLKEGGRFVNAVWKNGWLLRKKATFDTPLVPVEIDWKEKAVRMDTLVCNAEASMKNMLSLIKDSPVLMDDTSLLLLHQLIDMGVKTYLRCVVGFIPEGVSLHRLMDWCAIADTQVIDFFFEWNEVEKKVLVLAMESERVCWMGEAKNFSSESKQVVRKRAERLVEFFLHLCKESVQSMQSRIVEPIAESATI
ncbi:HEPN domain-containing protein [Sphingobacterium paucimobilis]|uniref:HEPN domain-containing protein n=1 Tax=Sphingobacterium paucimobilis HER1398 TaxID=1346330 RepID=U2JAF0_9SPHI|nr:HEPN domain-containing protein [Sphingobacterium paucimobilis]ERJ59618.1 hypothetical protein M472_12630 [Sphingobacterium paucimobilis HER1398]